MGAFEGQVTAAIGKTAVSYHGVGKRFGATQALRGLDLDIAAGTCHAFVGENGAGKSTTLGVLAGRIAPSEGTVKVFGDELPLGDPRASRHAGVATIYQELTIVPALSAEANAFLGQHVSRHGILSEREMRRRYMELCEEIGVAAAPPKVHAGSLSVAEQQLLEIARGLLADARILLLDEPTAALALPERNALLRLIHRLREEQGMTVVIVSHNLDEVLEVSETVSVFRDGELRKTAARNEWTKATMVRQMLGDEAGDRVARDLIDEDDRDAPETDRAPRTGRQAGREFLRVEDLSVPGCIEDVSFSVRQGEILGLGGLVGSGRTTVLRTLAGLEPRASGRLWIEGRETKLPTTVARARKLGIALLPEDRKSQGLVLEMSSADNVILSDLGSVSRAGILTKRRVKDSAGRAARDCNFRMDRLGDRAGALSGGNQQKLMFARWRHSLPRLLLADEPTRGIDIGAKSEVLDSLEVMATEGLSVIFVSSELEEVTAISDRILVLAEGRPAGLLERGSEQLTSSEILHTAFGVEEQHA